MLEQQVVHFSKTSLYRQFRSSNADSVAIIVSAKKIGFPDWAVALAEDFCRSETLVIPESPSGWNIDAHYYAGAHRMAIFHDSTVVAQARILYGLEK